LASWLHSSYKGKIKVGEQLWIALVGVTIGLLLSVPLLWLSWKIPQQLLMEGSELHLLTSSEQAMCGLQWQDVLFVSLLCVCASSAALLWGLEVETFVAFAFCAVLLLLARIDARTHLLPDVLTQPLLWLGLLWHAAGLGERSLELAVWGAALVGCLVRQDADGAWRLQTLGCDWRMAGLLGFTFCVVIGVHFKHVDCRFVRVFRWAPVTRAHAFWARFGAWRYPDAIF
jgi:hypothetical protein